MNAFQFGRILSVAWVLSGFAALAQAQHTEDEAHMLISSDLKALSALQFENVSVAHKKIFESADGRGLARFFASRMNDLSLSDAPDLVVSTNRKGAMRVGPDFFQVPQIVRWSALIHEAAHNDVDRPDHVACPSTATLTFAGQTYSFPQNPKSGELACDATGDGGYGVQYAFLMSIAESCSNCTPQMKKAAGRYALMDVLIRITDKAAQNRLVSEATLDVPRWSRDLPSMMKDVEEAYRN